MDRRIGSGTPYVNEVAINQYQDHVMPGFTATPNTQPNEHANENAADTAEPHLQLTLRRTLSNTDPQTEASEAKRQRVGNNTEE